MVGLIQAMEEVLITQVLGVRDIIHLYYLRKKKKINTISLNFERFLNQKNKPLLVDVFINDVYLETLSLIDKKDLNIKLNISKITLLDDVNTINFNIKNPITPLSRFESVDGRLLGFLLKSIKFK